MKDEPRLPVESAAGFGEWLAQHHATAGGVWLVTWRATTGRPAPAYEELVTEALRYGWIDSTVRTVDDERTMLRFSRRRRGSAWAGANKERIRRLEAAGRLEPAGRAVVDAARADGSWSLLDSVEALEVPGDLGAAFDAHPPSWERWAVLPPSAKKAFLWWIVEAKRPQTRARRIAGTAEKVARGERLDR